MLKHCSLAVAQPAPSHQLVEMGSQVPEEIFLPVSQQEEDVEALAELRKIEEGQSSPKAAPRNNAAVHVQESQETASQYTRFRLLGKQPAPPEMQVPSQGAQMRVPTPGEQALASEAWREMVLLEGDVRRQHMHWTHSRTTNAADRQPESFTREGFFGHLAQCYKEVNPEPANPLGSILLFGAVAKERHAACDTEGARYEHHHAPTYTSKRHCWKPVADLSYKKYRVKLHAADHAGYATMYNYIPQATPKKPASELDAPTKIFHSTDHPKGDVLRKLLRLGAQSARALAPRRLAGSKRVAAPVDAEVANDMKRFRRGDVFGMVATEGVRSTLEIQNLASQRANAGDTRLAEFCTSCGEEQLDELVRSAVAVIEAPIKMERQAASRMDLLRRSASEGTCCCNGIWMPAATRLLNHHKEDISKFCQDVCAALEMGATRGTNMAIVGVPGCGKSMLFEPLDEIFVVMGKPEAKNSFVFAGLLDAQVLLWHEYKHKDSIVLFEDLLAVLVGERLDVRIPHKKAQSHRNNAPMFYTSNSMMAVVREDRAKMELLNTAMAERFCTRVWTQPIPKAARISALPRCGRCCSQFFLMNR